MGVGPRLNSEVMLSGCRTSDFGTISRAMVWSVVVAVLVTCLKRYVMSPGPGELYRVEKPHRLWPARVRTRQERHRLEPDPRVALALFRPVPRRGPDIGCRRPVAHSRFFGIMSVIRRINSVRNMLRQSVSGQYSAHFARAVPSQQGSHWNHELASSIGGG